MRSLAFALCLGFALIIGTAHAQFGPALYVAQPAGGGGGAAGTFALVAHAGNNSGGSTASTPVNCTGATMAVVVITTFTNPAVNPTPVDTASSTYTQIGSQVGDTNHNSVAIWWANISGTLTSFHWSSAAISFGTIEGACFSDGSTPSSLDQNSVTATSNQPGSVTPGSNNELLVTGYTPPQSGTGTPTINSSFIVTDAFAFNSGGSIGGGMAYKIQTSAGAENPTWATTGGGTGGGSVIATFR